MRETASAWMLAAFSAIFLSVHGYVKWQTHPSFSSVSPSTGETANSFSSQTLDKRPFQLTTVAAQHRLTVINFWESWCGPCNMELPGLVKMYARDRNRGLAMVGISGSSSDESVKEIVQKLHIDYPLINDHNGALAAAYHVEAVPTTLVVDSSLKILRSRTGIDDGLEAFIDKQLSQPRASR